MEQIGASFSPQMQKDVRTVNHIRGVVRWSYGTRIEICIAIYLAIA